jgi:hypothetical protein
MIETSKSTYNSAGTGPVETTIVRFGPDEARRSVEFRPVTLTDQWRLSEIAGDEASRRWQAMSLVALSVLSIDNVPVAPVGTKLKRADIETVMNKLGIDGFNAISEAQAPVDDDEAADPEAAHRAQVGNSSETPLSAA